MLVRHVPAGPFEDLDKADLPAQLCQFTFEVLRTEAAYAPGRYDLVHGHYWLSGQVGAVAKERWGVPLVQSMHTLGKVKNAALASGDAAEPAMRLRGEAEVVAAADRLVANTDEEARQLVGLYARRPGQGLDRQPRRGPVGVPARAGGGTPGAGSACPPTGTCSSSPAGCSRSRHPTSCCGPPPRCVRDDPALGRPADRRVRRRAERHRAGRPRPADRTGRTRSGSPAWSGWSRRARSAELADWYRAATVVMVPSYSESFGLVAVEAQACGTPVIAASVGGLRTAVQDGVSGVLVDGHDPADYARALRELFADPARRARLSPRRAWRTPPVSAGPPRSTGCSTVYAGAMSTCLAPESYTHAG